MSWQIKPFSHPYIIVFLLSEVSSSNIIILGTNRLDSGSKPGGRLCDVVVIPRVHKSTRTPSIVKTQENIIPVYSFIQKISLDTLPSLSQALS